MFHQFGLARQSLGAHFGLEIDAVINEQILVQRLIGSALTRFGRTRTCCGWNASLLLIAHHGAQFGVAFLAFASLEFAATHHGRIAEPGGGRDAVR